jgi:hypothetical protein
MAAWASVRGSGIGALARALAVLSLAGLALHELRYMSWLGAGHAHPDGHDPGGWLSFLAPALTVAAAFAVALVAATRWRAGKVDGRVRLGNLWLIASGGLLASFAARELLQRALHADHPFGLHGMFGHGGWVVVPLALLLGGVVAVAVGMVRELERRWRRDGELRFVLPHLAHAGCGAAVVVFYRARLFADHLAGRGPPSLAV